VPAFTVTLFGGVIGPSVALAILGMVEAISIGKAVSAKAHLKFFPNRELVAKGAGNVVGAFFGCMPSSASWTRSVVNLQMGARTRWVGVVAGVTVLAFMIGLAPLAQYVPIASLGALIIWIAWQMFDFAGARKVWRWSRKDAAVMLITAGAVFVMEIQYAIYLGVIASLILLLHSAGRLHMVEMIEVAGGRFRELEIDDKTGSSPIVLLQLEGDLFFGVVDELQERLARIAANGARVIIVRMKRTHGLDSTATDVLSEFATDFKASGGRVILCGLKPEMFAQIRRSDLEAVLEPQNLLPVAANTFDSVHQALDLARAHLATCSSSGPALRADA
jgi:SulP family sulfate permease